MRNPLDFFERKDCVRWLDGTICRYKQKYVYVYCDGYDRVATKNTICIKPLVADPNDYGKPEKILSTNDDFSTHLPTIGYLNGTYATGYLMRKPRRVQRAGLNIESLYYKEKDMYVSNEDIRSQAMINMFEDIYPTYQEAEKAVEWGERTKMAFAKNLAVSQENRWSRVILYKGEIAAIQGKDKSYYIPQPRNDTSFIQAILKRHGVEAHA